MDKVKFRVISFTHIDNDDIKCKFLVTDRNEILKFFNITDEELDKYAESQGLEDVYALEKRQGESSYFYLEDFFNLLLVIDSPYKQKAINEAANQFKQALMKNSTTNSNEVFSTARYNFVELEIEPNINRETGEIIGNIDLLGDLITVDNDNNK